ncbi:MAG: tetratricopeptide repeat protein [Nitrospira sp.]|nr:MAG: tetratricopeptide repeat protein [Nitrospira sp.]
MTPDSAPGMAYKIRTESKIRTLDQDQVLSRIDQLWIVLERRRRDVFIGVSLVLLAAVIVVGVIWYDHARTEALQDLDRQATKLYLDRPTDPAKADENLKKAIELYRKAYGEYPGVSGSDLVLYKLANALAQTNDFKGAIEAYLQFIAKFGVNKLLLGMVYQRLGYAYLLNKEPEQAIKTFTSLLDVPGALNKDQAMFELGKMEEARSRPEGALARYQDLMKAYPNSPFAGEASVRVKALEAKMAPASATAAPQTPAQAGSPGLPAPNTPAPASTEPAGKP